MSVQTSYEFNVRPGIEGLLAREVMLEQEAFAAETAIVFGRAVARGTAEDQVKLIEDGDSFLGVARHIIGLQNPIGGEKTQYEIEEGVSVIRRGWVWVYTETATSAGDPVWVRTVAAASPNNVIGRFRNAEAVGQSILIEGATFESSTTGAGLAIIRLVI